MSHSPLKMFKRFHNMHTLICGQGPIEGIARDLGFTNITTVDQIRELFPNLDMVDHSHRKVEVNKSYKICNPFKLKLILKIYKSFIPDAYS